MKNLKNVKFLTKKEQKMINGGVFTCGGIIYCPPGYVCQVKWIQHKMGICVPGFEG